MSARPCDDQPFGVAERPRARAGSRAVEPVGLALLTVALLAPFVGKAVHLDDPMYLWPAHQIARHPLDFYGIDVNWYGTTLPMAAANTNPPGGSYWLALVGSILGWSEQALHVGMLPAAIALVLGVRALARELDAPPRLSALVLLALPGVLVSSTTLMADTLAVAIWTWAVVAWIRGVRSGRRRLLAAAAALCSLCILTKYVALTLPPLLLAYSFMCRKHRDPGNLLLLVPYAAFLLFRQHMLARYGVDPLGVGAYSMEQRHLAGASPAVRLLSALVFAGGAFIPAFALSAWTVGRRFFLGACVSLVFAAAALSSLAHVGPHPLRTAGGVQWLLVAHVAVFAVAGCCLAIATLRHGVSSPRAESALLVLWIGGIFVFAGFLNWSVNVRALLPAAPAVAVLLASRVREATLREGSGLRGPTWALVGCVGVGLLVAHGDAALAHAHRQAAIDLTRSVDREGRPLWFQGAWGFQHYMERRGARKVDWSHVEMKGGDRIVQPHLGSNVTPLPREAALRVDVERLPLRTFATTMSRHGAGFYSDRFGPVPYLLGPAPDQAFTVVELTRSLVPRPPGP